MTKKTIITDQVERYVAMKRKLGYQFTRGACPLRSFARFAEDRDETFIRSETAIEWASTARSQSERITRLHTLHALACWLHAEDARHELPPRDALGYQSRRRPPPYLISTPDIRKLLTTALSMPPEGTIAPLTWHYMFGLIAVTGLRIGEALALTLDDITPDGLVIRDTKFGKSRMVALHPTTQDELDHYLTVRREEKTPDRHLFVITTGRPPCYSRAQQVFQAILERTGIREPGAARGPTLHSLRHSFAVRALENLDPGADPGRHMLALSTYLGHAKVSHTYWYLESTLDLLRGIAEAAEQAHANGGAR
ncbi:MAG: tyrosine-type recombinase/integrase [Deltaproteobacteria bacterium]|nr:tyrosine-type recombinase/integrase [Deltaproteobacteria bacterium]